ncbi:MAG TPA: hypothetical protein VEC76_08130 [Streptosporangiaceae bacterium]|nr:hypothetical protein [Streptosporangiaceae bacterium]
MSTSVNEDDLSQLRAEFPGWRFGAHWWAAVSGPDRREVWGRRVADGALLTAWSAAALRLRIEAEEAARR